WRLTAGGMFDQQDVAQRARVCVLGVTPWHQLFGGRDPLGESVVIGGGLPCRVIGILAEKGASTSGSDLDDVVVLPVTTFNIYIGLPNGYSSIESRPEEPDLLDEASAEVTEILRRSHRIGPNDLDDFRVTSPAQVIRAADQTTRILTGLLAGIAAVSLLVGG